MSASKPAKGGYLQTLYTAFLIRSHGSPSVSWLFEPLGQLPLLWNYLKWKKGSIFDRLPVIYYENFETYISEDAGEVYVNLS